MFHRYNPSVGLRLKDVLDILNQNKMPKNVVKFNIVALSLLTDRVTKIPYQYRTEEERRWEWIKHITRIGKTESSK